MLEVFDSWIPKTITTSSLIAGLIVIFIINIILNWFKEKNYFRKYNIPGPLPLPTLAVLWNNIRKGFAIQDVEVLSKYGKIAGFFDFGKPVVMTNDFDLMRNVLMKDFNNFTNRRPIPEGIFQPPMDKMLTILKDDEWKNVRSIISATFSSSKMKLMSKLMIECADSIVNHLDGLAKDDKYLDTKEVCGYYTLSVISSCCFGVKVDAANDPNSKFLQYMKSLFSSNLFQNPKILLLVFAPKLSAYLSRKKYVSFTKVKEINFFADISNEILRKRRDGEEKRDDFIQIMVDHENNSANSKESEPTELSTHLGTTWKPLKKTLTDGEILSQALTFYIAGFETTATTLSFLLYNLALNKDCQDKLFNEVNETYLKYDEKITYEMVNDIPYLDMVIHETLRMYPPAVRLEREVNEDYEYQNYTLPKGSIVIMPIWAIHYDPNIYPNPTKFDPERFSTKAKNERDNLSFLGFGSGPRVCIAMRFAIVEMKILIAKLILKFEFLKSDKTLVPIPLETLGLLKAKKPVLVKLKLRS